MTCATRTVMNFLSSKDVQRLIEPRTNNAHGVGQTGDDTARNIPRLGQRIGESPEVAQQFFLTSTQHANDRKGSAASFIKHPSTMCLQGDRVGLLSHGRRGWSMPVDLASADLPHEPGVYLFKNAQGRVLYVGKATRLNERIRSYFASNPDRHMIPELVSRADDIECIVTQTPKRRLSSSGN